MARYYTPEPGNGGWTPWIRPRTARGHKGYELACCDCGLVHTMQFKAASKKTHRIQPGSYVIMRAKRNARATGNVRRSLKARP